MKKTFILDTNVILHDAQAIQKFQEHDIVIPITVIEEVDRFKKEMNELGRNARFFSNLMDDYRAIGSLKRGVVINELMATIKVEFASPSMLSLLPEEFDKNLEDNKILAVALGCRNEGFNAIMVTKDTNLRIKADCLGLPAEDYENGRVEFNDLFKGYRQVECDEIKKFREPVLMGDADLEFEEPLYPNEYLALTEHHFDVDDVEFVRYRPDSHLEPEQLVPLDKGIEAWGLIPRNDEQRMALELLMDDTIKLVTLVGKAGTGKCIGYNEEIDLLINDELYNKIKHLIEK